MKRVLVCLVMALLVFGIVACGKPTTPRMVEGNLKTYYEMPDDTWQCDGYTYQYRLEIRGRLHGAVRDSVYVYLSNIEEISFQKAAMAGGLSSNLNDYFALEEAVLVELHTI